MSRIMNRCFFQGEYGETLMSKRLVGLDYIRVFSVLVICAFHTSIHLHCNYGIVQDFIQNGAVF